MDLTICREDKNLDLNIYRKPTSTDTCFHQLSNHPNEHKAAAFRYYIHRMQSLPISEEAKQKEWNTILNIGRNNGYPKHWLNNIREKMANRTHNKEPKTPDKKKWITFKYFSPAIRRISNLFKDTNLKIAFRPHNTIKQQMTTKENNINPSDIYRLQCNTCKNTCRPIWQRHKHPLQRAHKIY